MANLLAGLDGRNVQAHTEWLKEQIEAKPQDASLHLALCHFLALRGNWEDALDAARKAQELDSVNMTPAVASCSTALRGEQQREAFWRGQGEPVTLNVDRPEWVTQLIEAVGLDARRGTEAATLRAKALEEAPGLIAAVEIASKKGTADEDCEPTEIVPVDWLSDGDSRLGPVLEVLGHSGYGWMPFTALRRLTFKRPQHLVDLIWAPVQMTLLDGTTGNALVPVRYAGVGQSTEESLVLGRRTDWRQLGGDDQYAGVGQRVLITDEGDYSWLDLRSIEFGETEPEDEDEAA